MHVTVELECDRDLAFSAFTDPAMFSEWLGVPVTLDHGRFAATLEWGTRIRGQFEVLVPPELIAIRWDFDDDVIPLPGRELTAYLRFTHTDSGSTIEVHQLVTTAEQADFMQLAWGLVFGRLATGIHQAG